MKTSDNCGCCSGVRALTPVDERQPPGQSALALRIGTHGHFHQSMLADLAREAPLAGLTTRDGDDPAIALLDGWAAVLDVLSFYQERIGNELYLRTATERRSVLELARAIGYELQPGVAASTWLAFTLETAPGAPLEARLDRGTRAQSVPGQDETAQTFETLDTLEARARWNALPVQSTEAVPPHMGQRTLYLVGTATRLQPGDALLVIGDERSKGQDSAGDEHWDFRRVTRVREVLPSDPGDPKDTGCTVVTLDRGLGSLRRGVSPALVNPRCFALRARAHMFGHNAPDWRAMPANVRANYLEQADEDIKPSIIDHSEWPHFTLAEVANPPDGKPDPRDPSDTHRLYLDNSYPKWLAGGWVVLALPDDKEVYRILRAEDGARTGFTLSATATRLTLQGERFREVFSPELRATLAFGQSEPLDWGTRPLSGLLEGKQLLLASDEPDLAAGRWLAVSGLVLTPSPDSDQALARLQKKEALAVIRLARDRKTAELEFEDFQKLTVTLAPVAEIVRIRQNDSSGPCTQLLLDSDLRHAYLPATVRLNANVAPASAGDSKQMRLQPEPLGSGDGSRSLQRFPLRQGPLTHTAAATPSGTASTLEVRVDGLRWQQAPRFTALGPTERAYTVRLDEHGGATVQFGDGVHGTRLPTGSGNIEARYRVGLGAAGNVKAEQISLLLTRPLGVKAVSNPVRASGGTDGEAGDEARRNAPLTVRTLERIVSLSDFEDFAAAFTGIGKAQAVWLWDGEQRLVHLTVAGADGAALDPLSPLYLNLLAAIDAARPPHQPLRVSPCRDLRFGLTAGLCIAPDHEPASVLAAAVTALKTAFCFAARDFGQSLDGSEVLAVLQRIHGVLGVDLDQMVQTEAGASLLAVTGPAGRLPAHTARWQAGQLQPADLMLLDAPAVKLTERPS